MTAALEHLFRRRGLKRLVEQLAKQLRSRGRLQQSTRIEQITAEERTALLSLTGTEYGTHAVVDLNDVHRVLKNSSDGRTLEEVVEAIIGKPLREHATRKRARKAAWDRLFLDARSRTDGCPALLAWVEMVQKTGMLRSSQTPDKARELLGKSISIAMRLPIPISQSVRLARFAAQTCGDAHALDHDRPLGRLLIAAAAAVVGADSPSDAASRRNVWNAVGIIPDELSSTVLVWNLRANCGSLVGNVLNLHADQGEPVRLTLAQLIRHAVESFHAPGDGVISICENPAVMEAAAAELGAAGRPLICTEGQPGVAVMQLLTALHRERLPLRYHGDFDWGGIHIGNRMWKAFPQLIPWRFMASDYVGHQSSRRLDQQFVSAAWDPDLAGVMHDHGLAVEEELVLGDLLADLRT